MSNKYIKILIWVFVIGTVALAVFELIVAKVGFSNLFPSLGKDNTVTQQLTDIKEGNITAAYDLFSNQGKTTLSIDQFKKLLSTYPALSKNKTYFFSSTKYTSDQGVLNGTFTADDGTVTPVEYRLIYENGSWKILSITVNPQINP